MYQTLLTRRYLTTKVMPLLAVLAVMLCTAMVVIVWSIMGGFLTMLLSSGRGLVGDVSISWPTAGFGHYEDLVRRLEADPNVAAAAPVIESFGMVMLPDNRVFGVSLMGVEGDSYARVADYPNAIWWKTLDKPLPKDRKREDPRLQGDREVLDRLFADGKSLTSIREERTVPAVVPGIEVAGYSDRRSEGFYSLIKGSIGARSADGSIEFSIRGFLPGQSVTLTVLPMSRKGRIIQQVTRSMPVANEFRSGLYEIDSKTILVNLGALQEMLKMDAAAKIDPASFDPHAIGGPGPDGDESFEEPAILGVEPARVTTVLVRALEGVSPEDLKDRVLSAADGGPHGIYPDFAAAHPDEVPSPSDIIVNTWRDRQATFIAAVEKEIVLVLGIIVFISFVASFLILAIFWAMVAEKTRDVGILRAVGASRSGVAWLWLSYGLAIGVLGSAFGSVIAITIVHNINPIHDWLGRVFHVSIWNPDVYYFTEIPSRVEPIKVAIVIAGGIFFSALGALVPSLRAAFMHPVRALRFE